MSDASLTLKEKIGGIKKKFKQRSAMIETMAEETKSPTRDCKTTTIRKRKPVTVKFSPNP
jgi:hypothetical protein